MTCRDVVVRRRHVLSGANATPHFRRRLHGFPRNLRQPCPLELPTRRDPVTECISRNRLDSPGPNRLRTVWVPVHCRLVRRVPSRAYPGGYHQSRKARGFYYARRASPPRNRSFRPRLRSAAAGADHSVTHNVLRFAPPSACLSTDLEASRDALKETSYSTRRGEGRLIAVPCSSSGERRPTFGWKDRMPSVSFSADAYTNEMGSRSRWSFGAVVNGLRSRIRQHPWRASGHGG